jgi:hypothetical protein
MGHDFTEMFMAATVTWQASHDFAAAANDSTVAVVQMTFPGPDSREFFEHLSVMVHGQQLQGCDAMIANIRSS